MTALPFLQALAAAFALICIIALMGLFWDWLTRRPPVSLKPKAEREPLEMDCYFSPLAGRDEESGRR